MDINKKEGDFYFKGRSKYILNLLIMFMLFSTFSFVKAETTTHQQNTSLEFAVTSNTATSCILTTINKPSGIENINQEATKNSQTFNFTILSGNFTELGIYRLNIECLGGNSGYEEYEVTLSGVEKNPTLIISNIFLILLIIGIIFLLHYKYKGSNYQESNKKIGESHNGNWSRTFIKTLGNNLMRNSFLWYYSLGWLLLIVLKDLVYNFNTEEVYTFLLFSLDIYSFGFFLVIVVWIGILIHHFRFITELINDLNIGVSR